MNNKDIITFSLTIFRHTIGLSFWTKSEPSKLEEKVDRWKNEKKEKAKSYPIAKGGYIQAPLPPAEPKVDSAAFGTKILKAEK